MMEYNLGFLSVLLFYLFSIGSVKTSRRIVVLILFPVFYYLAGAYVMLFAGMFGLHVLFFDKGKQRYCFCPPSADSLCGFLPDFLEDRVSPIGPADPIVSFAVLGSCCL